NALNSSQGKFYDVQGPPGTGKSHTITAIVFDSLLKGNSILVLSDKNEALDVVEDKITETLNKIRREKNFQNPILRLGRSSKTYTQILATQNIEKIKQHYKVVKNKLKDLDHDIEHTSKVIESRIRDEIIGYSEVNINNIRELQLIEKYLDKKGWIIEKGLVNQVENLGIYLNDLSLAILSVSEIASLDSDFTNLINRLFKSSNLITLLDLKSTLFKVDSIIKIYKEVSKSTNYLDEILLFGYNDYKKPHELTKILEELIELRNPIWGYLFKKKNLDKLNFKFREAFPNSKIKRIEDDPQLISNAVIASNNILDKEESYFPEDDVNLLNTLNIIKSDETLLKILEHALEKIEDINYLLDEFENEKRSIVLDQINLTHNLDTIINNKITALLRQPDDFSNTIRYFTLYGETINKFKSIKNHNFNIDIKSLEEMVTTKMSFILDERVINFYENNRSAARVLRDVIRKKQKFPQDEFDKLKSAFPCIISSIRDYAEYIPLKENLFDLVIIDEASQVSIAQAFPALLRAKKILVLGDQRQFSNVKANQAKSDTNQDYLNKLNQVYLEEISSNPAELIKLGKFNIKTSVLEFFEFISNFNIQLTKHFRGYKELISYSNKYFYQNNLQVMKIRAKKIDDVLKFTQLNVEKTSDIPNTNIEEIEFIVSQLENNYNEKKIQSIGIITPHTNQQKLFAEIINQLDFKDYLYEENKLKIMTFDTCQGEERDLIYYSMVATKEIDRLWGVFIKDLSKIDIEEEGKIKAQRLNVGLSRARECMHFVISKPIEEFTGSIGEALRHYSLTLKEAKSQKDISTVDKNSPMEAKVLEWFYQTSFYSQNKNNLEFIPQFKLGEYLKQLDPFYSHPNYTVDFLLVYKDSMNNERKIIIEYDGFQEHFVEVDEVNEYNYENYYSEDDIYRQKVLESYGYKFLRINRFNLTQDPVSTLNTRILELISGNYSRPKLLENISETISSLQNRDMLECPKCNEIKTLSEFKDNNLISGVGRYCSTCKKHTTKEEIIDGEKKICPTCKSNMILRSGRYGLFYGCNRYPFCYGTRKLS
ncbi:MAG TPA: AAA domain-containing protein, partial [Candidatus Woesebacteria bacterium]|nr:AAA domain-containing protein [Candidatus Woesebacteria bacterium]